MLPVDTEDTNLCNPIPAFDEVVWDCVVSSSLIILYDLAPEGLNTLVIPHWISPAEADLSSAIPSVARL